MLGLTDGDVEGNLLVLLDGNLLAEANGDLMGLQMGTLKMAFQDSSMECGGDF